MPARYHKRIFVGIMAIILPLIIISKSWSLAYAQNPLGTEKGIIGESSTASALRAESAATSLELLPNRIYLPAISVSLDCPTLTGLSFGSMTTHHNYPANDPPPNEHPDLNLAMRGYRPTNKYLGLVDYNGDTDRKAPPQLRTIFSTPRLARINAVYQVYQWDWINHKPKSTVESLYEVNLAGLETIIGERIHVPDSGYSLGSGYEVIVLYAEKTRITLNYTLDDKVTEGYTIHFENLCVDPRLLSLYEELNGQGRNRLPALQGAQAFASASSNQINVSVRDRGSWLDPRSCKDWWKAYGCIGAQIKLQSHPTGLDTILQNR